MRILIIHNHYLESGGEDSAVATEANMLRDFGEQVILYERSNSEIEDLSFSGKICFSLKDIVWSDKTYLDIRQLVSRERPDIAHIHNPFVMMSPSLYSALKESGIPIVQTLHNYRILCLNGLFYRDGHICELCKAGNLVNAFIRRCWRGSFLATVALSRMLRAYRKSGVFKEKVDRFIALSEFSKNKFIEAGIPEKKIDVKPNTVGLKIGKRRHCDDYALYIGRLAGYKGIDTLMKAHRTLDRAYRLVIIGDGPLYEKVRRLATTYKNIEVLSRLDHEKTMEYLSKSAFLVFPSECFENMPRTIIESYAFGVPVLASNIGAVAELVQEGVTGMLFEAGNHLDLADKIKQMNANPALLKKMGEKALEVFRQNYSQERNYRILMDIYAKAVRQNKKAYG